MGLWDFTSIGLSITIQDHHPQNKIWDFGISLVLDSSQSKNPDPPKNCGNAGEPFWALVQRRLVNMETCWIIYSCETVSLFSVAPYGCLLGSLVACGHLQNFSNWKILLDFKIPKPKCVSGYSEQLWCFWCMLKVLVSCESYCIW